MTRQAIIEKTLKAINQLPPEKAEEISDFADFISKRYDEYKLTEGIQQLVSNSQAFEFLNNEEELYSEDDLKEVYDAKKGDVVLIPFPFTNLTGSKLRPAVVLIDTSLDLTVCFITTQIQWHEKTDVLLSPNTLNGLRKISLIRVSKIATLDKSLAKGLLGTLSSVELSELDSQLKILLQLP